MIDYNGLFMSELILFLVSTVLGIFKAIETNYMQGLLVFTLVYWLWFNAIILATIAYLK